MNILVAIPSYDRRVDIEVAKGLLQLERDGYDFDLVMPISSHISRNRNYCVHEFLKGDYEWLLFWDSDIAIEQGFLKQMLDTAFKYDAQIVCGAYRMKKDEPTYVLGRKNDDSGLYDNLRFIEKVREIDAGGTGVMLIHRKVLEALPDPWFTIRDGADLFTMPEDFHFCQNAKDAGFKIMADPRFSTYHYGSRAWSHEPESKKLKD